MMTLNEWVQTPEYREAAERSQIAGESVVKGERAAPALTAFAAEEFAALDADRRNAERRAA